MFAIALSGDANASISGVGGQLFGVASGVLNVRVNGAPIRALQEATTSTEKQIENSGPGSVQITLGEAFDVSAQLLARASLDNFRGGFSNANGLASAVFGNSGGITSFALYDAAGLSIDDFSMFSESGEFQLYVFPEPNTALLIGLGLTVLGNGSRRRYERAANN